jgi:hypothetical protein
MTQDEAIEVLWSAKGAYLMEPDGTMKLDAAKKPIPNPKWCDAFVYATLGKDVSVSVEGKPKKPRVIKKGTRVLVTMVSRFGHVGIRDDRLTPASNGYCTSVKPEDLTDWGEKP